MRNHWKLAFLVTLGAVLGSAVALIASAGPQTASATDISDGLAIGLLFGIAIGSTLRWQRDRRKQEAA